MSTKAMLPGVTVVVPTLNRGHFLLDTVSDLLAQTHRPLEILIVDQSDTVSPELEALVCGNPDTISYHRVDFRGLPIARNYGWQNARHEIIVYVDDDIRCGKDFTRRYAARLSDPDIGVCGGGIDEDSLGNLEPVAGYDYWISFPRGGFSSQWTCEAKHIKGCNFGTRLDVLSSSVGGFDERLGIGAAIHEETDFMLRAASNGQRIVFDGTIRLHHLAAEGGGTRQPNYPAYVRALSHNRSIMIRRHSRWYQWPVGLAYSLKLIAAYTVHARDFRVTTTGLRGMVQGWRAGGRAPLFTLFVPETGQ